MSKKQKRVSIPKEVVLKLWALTAGRCEFLGCNKPLWRDGLTWQEANFAHIAHIIAASSDGPRGDKKLSRKLAKDFSNLMLVCLKHHKLIDTKKYEKKYTVELLRSYKQSHEQRIYTQTSMKEEMKTTILIFKAKVGDRMVDIPFFHTVEAVAPRFPADDKGIILDYTNLDASTNKNYWENLKSQIKCDIKLYLKNPHDIKHLSIFAIGPIPLLIYLGKCIGNIIPIDLYQRHRDTQCWTWKFDKGSKNLNYIIKTRNTNSKVNKIILVLSLSGKIHLQEIKKLIPQSLPYYEITIKNPTPLFLYSKDKLVNFQKIYRELITKIREKHGSKCQIHLFSAVPAPIAVSCGKELLPKVDPPIFVYDHVGDKQGFKYALKVN
ncbi:hypothetical protein ES703_14153 [subsurface metagenome]